MANKKDVLNPSDINNPSKVIRSSDLLPAYHKTEKNIKFLSSTLDQFIQKPELERINGFVGSKLSLNYDPSKDTYIDGGSSLRNNYQLEPSLVIRDVNNSVFHASTFDDLINQLNYSGAKINNLDRLIRPESVSFDPCIDWDKFVNFRQYYWMPMGPDTIEISGDQQAIAKTYSVIDSKDGFGLEFRPAGSGIVEKNPLLTLYRGTSYTFNIESKYPIYIKTAYVRGNQSLYENAIGQGTNQINLIIDDFTPNTLFYFAEGNDYAVGTIDIKRVTDSTFLDVEADVLGKLSYTSNSGVVFSNGMKVRFVGNVTPEKYKDRDFFIEGVGTGIVLIDVDDLRTVGIEATNLDPNFDATPFDEYPFDDFTFVPLIPEYITINRSSPDLNSWSRYNRWVHEDVIAATAAANNLTPVYPVEMRAQRPIIEFISGLQLFNFGSKAKKNVDLIDNVTTNAFALFERSSGFYIDGVQVEQGFRVVFNADTDPLVRGRIFVANLVVIDGKTKVDLVLAEDGEPTVNDAVVSIRGETSAGLSWWFDGDKWVYAQQKDSLNQAPLFELYDDNGNRFSDTNFYNSSFKGTKVFGYSIGTGSEDPVLGFPLNYRNVANVGDYLFENYFNNDSFTNFANGELKILKVSGNYLKVNTASSEVFRDIWVDRIYQPVPIVQFQVPEEDTAFIEITAVETPGYVGDLIEAVFVNDIKQIHNVDYIVQRQNENAYVVSTSQFNAGDRILIKLFSNQVSANENGYYEPPVNLTNNPLNSSVSEFTFTEISDHVKSIIDNNHDFVGYFPGQSNLRDLPDLSKYGSRILCHKNPISFAHYFLGTKQHDIITAVRKVAFDYNQYKSNLLNTVAEVSGGNNPGEILDMALSAINANKDSSLSYNYSDMLAYGKNYSTRKYTVTHPRNTQYSLETVFDSEVLSERAVLIYLNDELLLKDRDYKIDRYNARVVMLKALNKGDIIRISDYPSTVGNFVPPTPTKLGLYPKYEPKIYFDDTYANGVQKVIQGHDGSITVAFNDFRDDVLLEFETRIYNNIKASYRPELINVHEILPGAFRATDYSDQEITEIITPDFLQWIGYFGVDYQNNNTFDETNTFTYNYSSGVDIIEKRRMPGYWRAIHKYFYDTDRPHSHPWEMLGLTEKPTWWDIEYGPAPYTSGNDILWKDLEEGRIRQGSAAGVNPLYARPGLLEILPVDDMGNLLSPTEIGLVTTPIVDPSDSNKLANLRNTLVASKWKIGDHAPVETVWRRSSYWPFVCQIIMALTKPATYAASMFDPIRLEPNKFGQYRYGPNDEFITLTNVILHRDVVDGVRQLSSGYSVFVIETGLSKDSGHLEDLKSNLSMINYNLMAKVGGFVSKDKLQVTIDAVDPTSPYPGVLLPLEDYQIFFNQSTPVESVGISGIIIQKTTNGFAVRGYDKVEPYFKINKPYASNYDTEERIGGRSEEYTNWSQNTTYDVGQIIFYVDRYYRVKQKHNSGSAFEINYYQPLPGLPQVGGAVVLRRSSFDSDVTVVPYGTEFKTIQEVYDFIHGYGTWLVSKGFVFNDFIEELDQVSDWNFSAREFLYWTTQNWATNSIITLSPFANSIEYVSTIGVVDSLVNRFYEYSLLNASGKPFPINNFSVSRLDGNFTLTAVNTNEGIFFARLNVIQKEHAIIFNNYTMFNDVVYDIGTGYRQRRVNLKGFRTANWNGDFFSPGFVFDSVKILDWERFQDYTIGQVVRFSGKYYSAKKSIPGSETFDFEQWDILSDKPVQQLYPNFDYKISQFEDFYSLDIDNFDAGQQRMAQHLIGYTPRPYLNNIIGDGTAQYKFYQGYIKEKGTKNPLIKLSKSSLNNWQSSIDFYEEWAFRIGSYGGYNTYQEIETSLESTEFVENPQIVQFISEKPSEVTDAVYYKDASSIIIGPEDYDINNIFPTKSSNSTEDFEMPVAGYVRFDDIFGTAYNKNSILDIANNNQLKEGHVIWLGFTDNGDWDVLRYSKVPSIITNIELNIFESLLRFTTTEPHSLSVDDLISISQIDPEIDRCYQVKEVVSPTQFTVYTTLEALPILDGIITGMLFVFKSSRIETIDFIHALPYQEEFRFGDLIWVDTDENNNWSVYKKVDNYWSLAFSNGINKPSQRFGSNIIVDGNTIIASSPNYFDEITNFLGRVFVIQRTTTTSTPYLNYSYSLNDGNNKYYVGTDQNGFGESLIYDKANSVIIAGAPYASYVRGANANHIVNPQSTASSYVSQGVVKISLINIEERQENDRLVLTTLTPENNSKFGSSLYYSTITQVLMIGSPGENSGIGKIYGFTVGATTSSISSTYLSQHTENLLPGANYGSVITGDSAMNRMAVSAPGYYPTVKGSKGAVFVYDVENQLDLIQTITGDDVLLPNYFGEADTFGSVIKMSSNGDYLIIGSPYSSDPVRSAGSGVVDIFKWNSTSNKFVWNQRIHSPTTATNVNFGFDIGLNDDATQLAISLTGAASPQDVTFDTYSENLPNEKYVNDPSSAKRRKVTTFDSGSTLFNHRVTDAGSVHVYNRIGASAFYSYTQELTDESISSTSTFGYSVAVSDTGVYIGAPAILDSSKNGQIYVFDKKDTSVNGWELHRREEPLVDLIAVKSAKTINTKDDQILDYIDIIDPIKGEILETARQELKFISPYDPAIYSLGIDGVNTDPNASWFDLHVGELWWDISSIKYVWYEQGDLEYRKNNWNSVFPGCSIDVYEWVETKYLPSEWSVISDTPEGLSQGISGQPKFADNTVMSVKQVYNAVSNSFSNMYYYWVKNKVVVPNNIANRRISALEVANQIADPIGSGNKFMAFLDSNAYMLSNVKSAITNDNINLNIVIDTIPDSANRHTEWLLLQENDPNSRPNWLLEKKLIDSLLGHDSLGQPVPDTTLSNKLKYGIGVRPRQSMFVNRLEALRNIFEFVNSILINEKITGQVDFTNLEAKDKIPDATEYDLLLEDVYNLDLVPTSLLKSAELSAIVDDNGNISVIVIDNPGYGYLTPPSITIEGDGTGAVLSANINSQGQVISVDIIDSGKGYTPTSDQRLKLLVRPFVAVVLTDASVGGKWSVNQWDEHYKEWRRSRTQEFDTTNYWKYVDWVATDFDSKKDLTETVSSPYELNELVLIPEGSYVKVLNGGDGRYMIVRKTTGTGGTYDDNWDMIYSENGTIQFTEQLWKPTSEFYAWDSFVGFDQIEFDKTPDQELNYSLIAIRDDIFINQRRVYWNQLFFKAIRYAFSEQKTLDWVFKTAFISVVNTLGSLDQKHTYKLQNSQNYEDFLKEIKPYHTKIRKFTESYTSTELTRTGLTDFDLPTYYNTETSSFETVDFGNNMLLENPWNEWYSNYSYGIESIQIQDPGMNYTEVPSVNIVTAPGDTGFGASAVAYISGGKVTDIVVTDPGFGYTSTPTVVLTGGGGFSSTSTAITSNLLVPAKAYAQLGNNPVRKNSIKMKFDRISKQREIGDKFYVDTFVGDGEKANFDLTWVPVDDKSQITLTLNGVLLLVDSYRIEFSEKLYSPQPNTKYTKRYATLKLSFIPTKFDVIKIEYPKEIELYNALDRIEDYYDPASGMPGKDPAQLMTGMEYPGLQIDTLSLNAAGGWDVMPFGSSNWDNYAVEEGYISFAVTTNTTQTFILEDMIVTTGTQVNTYVNKVRIDSTLTSGLVPTIFGAGTGAVDRVIIQNPGKGYVPGQVAVTISAPNTINGVQARAAVTLDNEGRITDITIPEGYAGSGYTETPVITITGDCTIQAYAAAVLKSEFTTASSTVTQTSIVIPANAFTSTESLVEFRYASSDGTLSILDLDTIDSVINGGTINTASWTLSGALGVNPSEIVLDGGSQSTRHITGMMDDGFLNTVNSAAPEECVPGQVRESLAINVYSQPYYNSPIIVNKIYRIDGTPSTYQLGITPANTDSLVAVFENQIIPDSDYTIDYSENTFKFNSVSSLTGWLSLTTMQLGSIGLINSYRTVAETSGTVYTPGVLITDVGSNGTSSYVTIDGVPAVLGVDYTISVENTVTNRVVMTFNKAGTIQSYLFSAPIKSFSEVNEQTIVAEEGQTSFEMLNPPGVVEPYHSQVIVTRNGARLAPPVTTYYQVANGQTVFDISQSVVYPKRSVGLSLVEVYVNGTREPVPGIWRLNQSKNQISFTSGSLSDGDVIAIVVKKDHEYTVENGSVIVSAPCSADDRISITTFTNHDPDFIRTERFKGNMTNQYRMQRPILDISYVWVSYNGVYLIPNVDYIIDETGYLVTINRGSEIDSTTSVDDDIVITSFVGNVNRTSGFRMFRDMFGRTHYKRLSQQDTTVLAQDLYTTSTTILVEDASILTPPDILTNCPGIIEIAGERIEFFTINGNELGQIRRSTMGTGPREVYVAGTQVIDQGTAQTMPVREMIQTTSTIISTSSQTVFDLSNVIEFDTTAAFSDQIEVRYGGRMLLKPGLNTVVHDYDLAYDSTSTSDTVMTPEFTVTTGSILTLGFTPVPGIKLEVISRKSKLFDEPTFTFLQERSAALPDKYRYGQ